MKDKMLKTAYDIAVSAHAGQMDKAGNDYILHPITVAKNLDAEDEKAAALLHDVIEDAGITAEQLQTAGIPEEVVVVVQAMTHVEGEDYFSYIQRVKRNPLAKKVKLQDLKHNCDVTRIPRPTKKDFDRIKKYERAIAILLEA
ncbi:MAG: HD domain-containing protein [Anaerovoracaceae bacterium]|jgi:(p)ppGpp synthase/HD superfamily hydrolase